MTTRILVAMGNWCTFCGRGLIIAGLSFSVACPLARADEPYRAVAVSSVVFPPIGEDEEAGRFGAGVLLHQPSSGNVLLLAGSPGFSDYPAGIHNAAQTGARP